MKDTTELRLRPSDEALLKRRGMEIVAMALVGDGALSLADPRGHAELWRRGPALWRSMIEPFARRPGLTRALGAAMVVAGLWLARRTHRG